jgi:hypothetical protein
MPIDLRKFERLKRETEDARRQKDQAAGALSQAMKQLKDELGCETLDEAKDLERKLSKQLSRAEKDYNQELETFEEKWEEVLG